VDDSAAIGSHNIKYGVLPLLNICYNGIYYWQYCSDNQILWHIIRFLIDISLLSWVGVGATVVLGGCSNYRYTYLLLVIMI
jgi:hypothetical protein